MLVIYGRVDVPDPLRVHDINTVIQAIATVQRHLAVLFLEQSLEVHVLDPVGILEVALVHAALLLDCVNEHVCAAEMHLFFLGVLLDHLV